MVRAVIETVIAEGFVEQDTWDQKALVTLAFKGVHLLHRSLAERLEDCTILAVEAQLDRKSTRLNSSHIQKSRMPSSA